MQLIQHVTVGAGGQAQIDFNSLPTTFDDLLILVSTRINEVNATGEAIYITLNGSTANFTNIYFQGSGSSAASGVLTRYVASQPALQSTSNTFGNGSIYIPNYRSSVAKSIMSDSVSENNGATAFQALHANLWSTTSPITSISLVAGTNDAFVQHSSASLYGITRGSAGGVTVS